MANRRRIAGRRVPGAVAVQEVDEGGRQRIAVESLSDGPRRGVGGGLRTRCRWGVAGVRRGRGRQTRGVPSTELLYLRDAELRGFDAVVTAVDPAAHRVTLDRTAFYPTGGGQPHDTGTLAGRAVTDVRKEGDDVWHTLADDAPDLPAVGD